MTTLIPTQIQFINETFPQDNQEATTSTADRTIWYQGQYAIGNRFGSPQQYVRGRIVMKRGEEFYIRPFGKDSSQALHQSKVEFFSEDGKRQLSEEEIKALLKAGKKF